jgi:lysophospholipase L1-like esterase
VDRLEIGVDATAAFNPIGPRIEPPMVFYGTSILHGASASRPGMAFPSILGRRLDRPVINLGFSGNGRMDAEVATLLAELYASLYVIDCLPNMTPEQIEERTRPLVRQLQTRHPRTPIVLVEDPSYTNAPFKPELAGLNERRRAVFRVEFEKLIAEGSRGLHYVDGDALLGADGEGATDGIHPNDLGMMRYADALEPVLREILKGR